MFFSVVIPLYNKEKHIQRAINSVLAQTHQDFELIIVDDGSTDNSYLAACEIQDPRIRIIRQENRGVSAARNRGVAEAQYDWVAFLDADDEWLPEFLEKMSDLIREFPGCGIYGSGCYQYDGRVTYNFKTSATTLTFGWRGIFTDFFALVVDQFPYNSSSVIVSKALATRSGRFPEDITFREDIDTWVRIILASDAAFLNKPLCIYHQEAQNRTNDNPAETQKLTFKWKELLSNNQVPQKYIESFADFIVRYELILVRSNLKHGDSQNARKVLSQMTESSLYDDQISRMKRIAKFPTFILRLFFLAYKISSYSRGKLQDFLEIA